MEFLYVKDLISHRKECHTKYFTCPDCKMKVSLKANFNRHVLECRKQSEVFVCSVCDFSSNRKENLERHHNSQHLETYPKEEKQIPTSVICSVVDLDVFVVGCRNKVSCFLVSNDAIGGLEFIGGMVTDFEISSLENSGSVLVITGVHECRIERVSVTDKKVLLKKYEAN